MWNFHKADLAQKKLDWDRAQSLYQAGILAKQDFDAKQAAYATDMASLDQAIAGLNQAKAQTASARGHLGTARPPCAADQNAWNLTMGGCSV